MALTDSLTAYYSLDNTTDATGNGYTLTNTGTVPFNAAKIGNGADFTPNDALNNNSVVGALSYPRSVAGWVKFDSVSGSERTVFSIMEPSTHYYDFKCTAAGDLVFRSNNATQAGDVDTGINPSTATWYHFAVIQNSTTSVTIFVDNVETNTAAATYVATTSRFWLGYLGRSSVWYLDGIVDEVGIWNRALSTSEVNDLYNGGAGLAYPLTVTGGAADNALSLCNF